MKKSLMVLVIAIVLLIGLLLTGCQGKFYTYKNAGDYTIGGGAATGINDIDIDWYYGSVEIVYGDVSDITFSEVTDLEEKYQMRYLVSDGKLYIKSFKSGLVVKNWVWQGKKNIKDLTVTLPQGQSYAGLKLEVVNADVKIAGVTADGIEVKSVSGDVDISGVKAKVGDFGSISGDWNVANCEITDLSFETVSGDAKINALNSNAADFESTSGDWKLQHSDVNDADFETVSGNVVVDGGRTGKIKVETTSGNINLACDGEVTDAEIKSTSGEVSVLNNIPNKLDVKVTSGDISVFINDEPNFKVKFSTTSGDLKNNFAGSNVDGYYVVGSGAKEIVAKSVSGDLLIKRPDSDVISAG